jgi:hypothetical protein
MYLCNTSGLPLAAFVMVGVGVGADKLLSIRVAIL